MKKKAVLTPTRMIALCFLGLIVLGTALLALPVSHRAGQTASLSDAAFTATSAVCITGLVVKDTADTWSLFGRVVILALIQIGGFGVATVGVSITLLARKSISLRERQLVKEAFNVSGYAGISTLVRFALWLTLGTEAVGAALYMLVFLRSMSFWPALGMSVFHAVSAFNNAGFDLMGGFSSFTEYAADPAVNLITCALVIFGGLGYLVIYECLCRREKRRLSLQSKVVLVTTAALLIVGTLALKLSEGGWSWLQAFFQSACARTAGFATADLRAVRPATSLILTLLMFIGASPGSTGGGVKTTTFFVLLLALRVTADNVKQQAFKRRSSDETVRKAFSVTLMSAFAVLLSTLLLALLHPSFSLGQLLFEAVSAFSLVGTSRGVTGALGLPGRLLVMLTMFAGRLGPMTAATMLIFKSDTPVQYTEEKLTIG